jgi:hypothetical protein
VSVELKVIRRRLAAGILGGGGLHAALKAESTGGGGGGVPAGGRCAAPLSGFWAPAESTPLLVSESPAGCWAVEVSERAVVSLLA